jgi:hypothetical protein
MADDASAVVSFILDNGKKLGASGTVALLCAALDEVAKAYGHDIQVAPLVAAGVGLGISTPIVAGIENARAKHKAAKLQEALHGFIETLDAANPERRKLAALLFENYRLNQESLTSNQQYLGKLEALCLRYQAAREAEIEAL